MENKYKKPIFYRDSEEMNKPLSELMEELRSDVVKIRGKLSDIKRSYGWDDRIEHLEGGMTCMISAMYSIRQEWENWETKFGPQKLKQ